MDEYPEGNNDDIKTDVSDDSVVEVKESAFKEDTELSKDSIADIDNDEIPMPSLPSDDTPTPLDDYAEDVSLSPLLEDLNIPVYTRENTKEMILHNEYEEAQWASDADWAEQRYHDSQYLSAAAGAGIPGSRGLLKDTLGSSNEDEMPDKMRDYMQWSREPYYEEYNPDKE